MPRSFAQDPNEVYERLGVGVLEYAPRLLTQPPFCLRGAFALPAYSLIQKYVHFLRSSLLRPS